MAILISGKVDFWTMNITYTKDEFYIMVKRSGHEKI